MASRRTRINRAVRRLDVVSRGALSMREAKRYAEAAVDAAGCPDLMGAREAAEELEIDVSNLRAVAGLPDPVAELAATRVWDAEEMRRFARKRRSRNG